MNEQEEPRVIAWARTNPNTTLAIILTALTMIAGALLPTVAFWIFTAVMTCGGALLAAGYWYEQAIRSQAELFESEAQRQDLARKLEKATNLNAEITDVVTLLWDELELTPIPFEVIGDNVIPLQRTAGGDS